MKKVIFFISVLTLCSCINIKKMVKVECRLYDHENRHVELSLPRYQDIRVVKADAENGVEYVFRYKDSAVVYVSTFSGGSSINYENLRNDRSGFDKRFFSNEIDLQGVDLEGKLWREVKRHDVYVGYSKINSKHKQKFDQALDSFQLLNYR